MVQVQLGYAADRHGAGVVYARLTSKAGERLVRAAFRSKRYTGLDDREVSYAALAAVSSLLHKHKMDRVAFLIPDAALVADRQLHRELPPPLVLPYVRLGCELNKLKACTIDVREDPDLTQRAKSEVALTDAA